MSYYYAKFEENPCVGTDESTPLRILHSVVGFFYFCVLRRYTSRKNEHGGSKAIQGNYRVYYLTVLLNGCEY